MGEYFTIVNLDKKERVAITPLKFYEYLANENSKVLFWLLTRREKTEYKTLGRWAGDRVIVIGDYDEMYVKMNWDEYKDITCDVIRDMIDYAVQEGLRELAEFMIDAFKIHCIDIDKLVLKGKVSREEREKELQEYIKRFKQRFREEV